MDRLEDRQATAGLVLGVGFVLLVPLVVLLGSLLVTAWLAAFHIVPNVHATIWGWLSVRHYNPKGQFTGWGVSPVAWQYFMGVFSTYVVYQVAELACGGFRAFRRALT